MVVDSGRGFFSTTGHLISEQKSPTSYDVESLANLIKDINLPSHLQGYIHVQCPDSDNPGGHFKRHSMPWTPDWVD